MPKPYTKDKKGGRAKRRADRHDSLDGPGSPVRKKTKADMPRSPFSAGPRPEAPEHRSEPMRRATNVSDLFQDHGEIIKALAARGNDAMIQAFLKLRDHLKYCQTTTPGLDMEQARVEGLEKEHYRRIIYAWVDESNNLERVFAAWDIQHQFSIARLDSLIPEVVSRVLNLLDTIATRTQGVRIARSVLRQSSKSIYRALSNPRSGVCYQTLRLLNTLATLGEGVLLAELKDQFQWDLKSLPIIGADRSKSSYINGRVLWMRFVLAFFCHGDAKLKSAMLDIKDIVPNLFKALASDPYEVVNELLTTIYDKLIVDDSVRRVAKVALLSPHLVSELVKALGKMERAGPDTLAKVKGIPSFEAEGVVRRPVQATPVEGGEAGAEEAVATATDSIADLAERFIMAICTVPGVGLCYSDYGIYSAPKAWTSVEIAAMVQGGPDATEARQSGRAASQGQFLCNHALLRVLTHSFKPTSDERQMRIVVAILEAAPELITPFWRNFSNSFEPRLSLPYLSNTVLALKVLKLPVSVPGTDSPVTLNPPSVATLVEHIIPTPLSRTIMTRGIQHSRQLVRYRSLQMLSVVMRKLGQAVTWLDARIKQQAADSQANMASWVKCKSSLLNTVKRRLPEWPVLIAAYRTCAGEKPAGDKGNGKVPQLRECPLSSRDSSQGLDEQHSLVRTAVLQAMQGYQTHFSDTVTEFKFDVGKLLSEVYSLKRDADAPEWSKSGMARKLDTLCLHHALQLLEASPPAYVKWQSKVTLTSGVGSPVQHSQFGVILLLYLTSRSHDVQAVARNIALNAMTSFGLFDQDAPQHRLASEPEVWLTSLKFVCDDRSVSTCGGSATAEPGLRRIDQFIGFVETAVVKASTSPYRFFDRTQQYLIDADDMMLSPLLAAFADSLLMKWISDLLKADSVSDDRVSDVDEADLLCTAFINDALVRLVSNYGVKIVPALLMFLDCAAEQVIATHSEKNSHSKGNSDDDGAQQIYKVVADRFKQTTQGLRRYLQGVCSASPASELKAKPQKSMAVLISRCLAQLSRAKAADIIGVVVLDLWRSSLGSPHLEHAVSQVTRALCEWFAGNPVEAPPVLDLWLCLVDRTGHTSASLWHVPQVAECIRTRQLAPEVPLAHLVRTSNLYDVLASPELRSAAQECLLSAADSLPSATPACVALLLGRVCKDVVNGKASPALRALGLDCVSEAMLYLFDLVKHTIQAAAARADSTEMLTLGFHHTERLLLDIWDVFPDLPGSLLAVVDGASGIETQQSLGRLLDYCWADAIRSSLEWMSLSSARAAWRPLYTRIANVLLSTAVDTNPSLLAHALTVFRLVAETCPPDIAASMKDLIVNRLDVKVETDTRLLPQWLLAVISAARAQNGGEDESETLSLSIPPAVEEHVVQLWLGMLGCPPASDKTQRLLDMAVLGLLTTSCHAVPYIASPFFASTDSARDRIRATDNAPASSEAKSATVAKLEGAIDSIMRSLTPESQGEDGPVADGQFHSLDNKKTAILLRLVQVSPKARESVARWVLNQASHSGTPPWGLAKVCQAFLETLTCDISDQHTGDVIRWNPHSGSQDVERRALVAVGDVTLDKLLQPGDGEHGEQYLVEIAARYGSSNQALRALGAIEAKLQELNNTTEIDVRLVVSYTSLLRLARAVASRAEDASESKADDARLWFQAVNATSNIATVLVERILSQSPNHASTPELVPRLQRALEIAASTYQLALVFTDSDSAQAQDIPAELNITTVLAGLASQVDALSKWEIFVGVDLDNTKSKCSDLRETIQLHRQLLLTTASQALFLLRVLALTQGRPGSNFPADAGLFDPMVWLRELLDSNGYLEAVHIPEYREPLMALTALLWLLAKHHHNHRRQSGEPNNSSSMLLSIDQLEALFTAYNATLSLADQCFLAIFNEYEVITGGQSLNGIAYLFGDRIARTRSKERFDRERFGIERKEASPDDFVDAAIANRAIECIDDQRLRRTLARYMPGQDIMVDGYRQLGDQPTLDRIKHMLVPQSRVAAYQDDQEEASDLYDLRFLLPWACHVLKFAQSIDLRLLIERGIAEIGVMCLSSEFEHMRDAGYQFMDGLYTAIQSSTLRERVQLLSVLDPLKNAITERDPPQRVPFIIIMFIATALVTTLRPEQSVYPTIQGFLLKSPVLDLSSVPLFYRALFSASPSARRERNYVLRLIASGSGAYHADYSVFHRRNTLEHMLSLVPTPIADNSAARTVLAFLFNFTSRHNAFGLERATVVQNGIVLTWMHQHVLQEANYLCRAAMKVASAAAVVTYSPTSSESHGIGVSKSKLNNYPRWLNTAQNMLALLRLVLRTVANTPSAVYTARPDDEAMHTSTLRLFKHHWTLHGGKAQILPLAQTTIIAILRESLNALQHIPPLPSPSGLENSNGGHIIRRTPLVAQHSANVTLALLRVIADTLSLLWQMQLLEDPISASSQLRDPLLYGLPLAVLSRLEVSVPTCRLPAWYDPNSADHIVNSQDPESLYTILPSARLGAARGGSLGLDLASECLAEARFANYRAVVSTMAKLSCLSLKHTRHRNPRQVGELFKTTRQWLLRNKATSLYMQEL